MHRRNAVEYGAAAAIVLCALSAGGIALSPTHTAAFGIAAAVCLVTYFVLWRQLNAMRAAPDNGASRDPTPHAGTVVSPDNVNSSDRPATHRAAS